MQTFLPLPNFGDSAKCLDYRRLGKQRVETKQIYMALTGQTTGWVNHPATKMWRGYEGALLHYGHIICVEWRSRGFKDTLLDYFVNEFMSIPDRKYPLPSWVGNQAFHDSHKSNLIRKMPEHYQKFWPDIPDNLPYVWPI